jgi:hypothetical protein
LALLLHLFRVQSKSNEIGDAMTTLNLNKIVPAAVFMALLAGHAAAQNSAASNRTIVVSLDDRKLALLENGEVVKVFPVAVGKPSTPSPSGTFTIERRVANPTYHHNGRTVLPGPGNPVGTRWIGLSLTGYGIHGTNEPRSIGKAESHGCIRMARADVEELFSLVAVGDKVELVAERNQETAQLFGPRPFITSVRPAAEIASSEPTPKPPVEPSATDVNAVPSMSAMSEATAAIAIASSR